MIFWISIKIYILYISNISWKSGKIVHSFQCLHFSRASKFHSSFTCETTGPVEPLQNWLGQSVILQEIKATKNALQ